MGPTLVLRSPAWGLKEQSRANVSVGGALNFDIGRQWPDAHRQIGGPLRAEPTNQEAYPRLAYRSHTSCSDGRTQRKDPAPLLRTHNHKQRHRA